MQIFSALQVFGAPQSQRTKPFPGTQQIMTPTILVIDDSQVVLDVTRTWLESSGFQVFTHNKGTGCISLILQLKPDLVLLDVNMPTLTGDVVAKMLDKTASSTDTLVVLHSTLSQEELEHRVAVSGAHGCIRKTDKRHEFVRRVRRWLDHRQELVPAAPKPGADSSGTSGARPAVSQPESSPGMKSAQVTRSGTPPREEPERVTVLFVDTDMTALADYRDAARTAGLEAVFALSAAQAVRKIVSSTSPALVVADVELPVPGIDHLYEEARRYDRKYEKLFIMSVTDHSRNLVPKSFSGTVLRKPISSTLLAHTIQQTLSDRAVTA